MEEQVQTKFEGYALVEMMGHRRVAGMVTTEYIGQNAFLRVVTPELLPTEATLDGDRYIDGQWCCAGTVIQIDRPRQEVLVGTGSVYAITPCTEEEIVRYTPIRQTIIRRTERPALAAAPPSDDEPGNRLNDEPLF